MSFVSGIGFTCVDILYSGLPSLPKEGEEVFSKGFSLQLGGGVPATLINLARLGVDVKLATFLGDDLFSSYAKNEFRKYNANYKNVYKGSGTPVIITSALITNNDRSFVSYTDGVNINSELEDEIYNALKGAKVVDVHIGFLDVYKKLKDEGSTLVFDMGWDDNMSLEKYGDYLTLCDYYTPNKKEALKITNTTNLNDAIKVLSNYFSDVIIKLDKDGCLHYKDGVTTIIPPLENVTLIDSTGAGDAFLSGFLYGLYNNNSVIKSIAYGNVTGGYCVKAVGCLASYPTLKELEYNCCNIIKQTKQI